MGAPRRENAAGVWWRLGRERDTRGEGTAKGGDDRCDGDPGGRTLVALATGGGLHNTPRPSTSADLNYCCNKVPPPTVDSLSRCASEHVSVFVRRGVLPRGFPFEFQTNVYDFIFGGRPSSPTGRASRRSDTPRLSPATTNRLNARGQRLPRDSWGWMRPPNVQFEAD